MSIFTNSDLSGAASGLSASLNNLLSAGSSTSTSNDVKKSNGMIDGLMSFFDKYKMWLIYAALAFVAIWFVLPMVGINLFKKRKSTAKLRSLAKARAAKRKKRKK